MGRCGYGQRLPLLVISPYAKVDYVDHSLTDQTSILQFIEDNWNLGRIGSSSFDALGWPVETRRPEGRLILSKDQLQSFRKAIVTPGMPGHPARSPSVNATKQRRLFNEPI
jgi:hypothetical protein